MPESSSERANAREHLVDAKTGRPLRHRRGTKFNKWARIVHVYSSMISLLIVLFFSATGLTLNHPTWSIGEAVSRSSVKGTLPKNWKADGTVDWLVVSDYLRSEHGIKGDVATKSIDAGQGTLIYKGPGYEADTFINPDDGTYEVTVSAQGFLGVMNDLHKGRDAKSSWKWLIDVIAIVMIVISLTGLILQLFLRRRRRSTLIGAVIGGVIVVVLAILTTR